MDTFTLSVSQMQIGLDPRLIEDLLLVIVFLLVETWYHGKVRNKMLYLGPVQNPSIEQRHILHVKSCGYIIF
ncbi:hypothetical protein MTR67_033520 [Solanum verrucosum]|uniref:Uncharacterized protein n=1 Tax=Solanum verrucosum TaxID=315347 RepID=A0AAF0U645_SOLVR|nr:hypothetical protein MTR67_033520 [Solanum verrucosum]